MYSHLSGLRRIGAGDVPEGSALKTAGGGGGRPRASSAGASDLGGNPVKAAPGGLSAGRGPAVVHTIGGGRPPSGPSVHAHADAFQRRKGVVNTVGGAKDVTRADKMEAPRLPGKGERKGAQIMGFSTLDAHSAEGKARREAAEKREAAGGNRVKMDLVKVTGGGGRAVNLNAPGAKVMHTLNGPVAMPSHHGPNFDAGLTRAGGRAGVPGVSAPGTGGGGGGGGGRSASAGAAPHHAATTSSTNVLGGSATAGNAQLSAAELRAKRAAHFAGGGAAGGGGGEAR